ncbi:MAG: hypothetical protein ACTSWY_13645 [Promethearchaeota archaeon]
MKISNDNIAIAIIHGIGRHETQDNDFAKGMIEELNDKYKGEKTLMCKPVFWGDILQEKADKLLDKMKKDNDGKIVEMNFFTLRRFMINMAVETFTCQPLPKEKDKYIEIHNRFQEVLNALDDKAGSDAPLCIIAHSLGSIIASNFMWDLQDKIKKGFNLAGLKNGDTFKCFYTMGSPIAIWGLRYKDFGVPIKVDNWLNFYNKDDIMAYPISNLNAYYNIVEDIEVNVGGFLTSWNPLSHIRYWTDKAVIKKIVDNLKNVIG